MILLLRVQKSACHALKGHPHHISTAIYISTRSVRWSPCLLGCHWQVWLNPRDLPAPQDMRCGECSLPLSFLVQLYCPLDHEDDAFHRCLYVFCCPKVSGCPCEDERRTKWASRLVISHNGICVVSTTQPLSPLVLEQHLRNIVGIIIVGRETHDNSTINLGYRTLGKERM